MNREDDKHLFMYSDVNIHHEGWFVFSMTNLHGSAARDFVSSSGCEQMVTEPTHIDGGVLALVLTDFPDVVVV